MLVSDLDDRRADLPVMACSLPIKLNLKSDLWEVRNLDNNVGVFIRAFTAASLP